MTIKTINGATYNLQIDHEEQLYAINWRALRGSYSGYARFDTELEAAAVWAALDELI